MSILKLFVTFYVVFVLYCYVMYCTVMFFVLLCRDKMFGKYLSAIQMWMIESAILVEFNFLYNSTCWYLVYILHSTYPHHDTIHRGKFVCMICIHILHWKQHMYACNKSGKNCFKQMVTQELVSYWWELGFLHHDFVDL